MGRARCARRERPSRRLSLRSRRPAGAVPSLSFLGRIPRSASRFALAALLLAGAAGLGGEARAQSAIWSATLTVKDLGHSILGCSNNVHDDECSSSSVLTDDDFTHDGTNYAVKTLLVRSSGQLELTFDTTLTTASRSLRLTVAGTDFRFDAANIKTDKARVWNSSGLSWTAGDTVAVSLSPTPDNRPPAFVSGTVKYKTLTLTFDEDLDESSNPGTVTYSLPPRERKRHGFELQKWRRSGDKYVFWPGFIDTVEIKGKQVILTLSVPARHDHGVRVTYVRNGGTPLQDAQGNEVTDISSSGSWRSWTSVTNNTPNPAVTFSTTTLSVEEGDSTGQTYTVKLTAPPPAGETYYIPLFTEKTRKDLGGGRAITLSRVLVDSPLAFTSGNWNTGQTVTVTAPDEGEHFEDSANNTARIWHGARTAARAVTVTITEPLPDAPPVLPDAPTLRAAPGDGSVALTWTAPEYAGTITGWELRHGATDADGEPGWGEWTAIEGATGETAAHTVTGLENDTEYAFELRALVGEHAGAASGTVTATPAAPAAPGAPEIMQAEAGDGQVTLVWLPPAYDGTLTGWELRWGAAGDDGPDWGAWTAMGEVTEEALSHTVTGLENGTEYAFELRVLAGSATGAASATARATPLAACPSDVPADAIWSACLTVGSGRVSAGYHERGIGALSEAAFTVDGRTHTVAALSRGTVAAFGSGLILSFEDDPSSAASGWVLQVGGRSLALADAAYSRRRHSYSWSDHGIGWSSADAGKRVTVSLRPASAADPDGTRAGAVSLGTQSPDRGRQFFRGYTLDRAGGDRVDYYTFTTGGRHELGLGVRGQSVELAITLENADGETVGTAGPPKDPSKDQLHIEWLAQTIEPGTYYIRVEALADGATDYYLRFGLGAAPPAVTDPDGTRAGAVSLGAQSPERGVQYFNGYTLDRANGDAVDYYVFTTGGRHALGLGVRGQSVELKVVLEDANGATVGVAGPPKDPNKDQLHIEWLARTIGAGTYYIRVEALADGATDYYLRFGLTAPPPELSVADASAEEGVDATLDFAVTLDKPWSKTVTVDYATADGTATAGEDYTATSGTLTFATGETSKTVRVPILDDALDEGAETFTLKLTNARGAAIGDGEATGTIANSDPLQKMWLSRFGRTVADHVTTAVSDRLANPLSGAQVTVGGQSVNLAATEDHAALTQALTAVARALGAPSGPAPGGGDESGPGGWPETGLGLGGSTLDAGTPGRVPEGRELLLGSAFHLATDGERSGPGLAAWGRVTVGGFDGEAPAENGNVRLDGNVTTGILGADADWNRLLAGVAVSVSEGEGSFAQPGVDKGSVESTMTTVSPYGRLMVNDRLSVWGLAGWGTGDMTIVQDARAATETQTARDRIVTRTDLEMRLGAVGGRGALMQADESGVMDLALRADAFWVETESEPVSNEGRTTANASRVRLALEGSRAFGLDGGGTLTPGLELGLRHDGGDAETGTGLELGGRVSYTDPETGFGVEARARALIAHEDSDYREWGASGAVRLAPGERGRGLSFSLAPSWGAASSGVERLWGARDARGLAPEGAFEAEQRLEGELGYGLGLFGDRFTGTPNVGFGLSEGSRDWRLGWRLTPAGAGAAGFEISLDATRSESANDDAAPEHGVMLRGSVRW